MKTNASDYSPPNVNYWGDRCCKAEAEVERLRRIVHLPLSEAELKLIDKNCDWIAFKHAWNALMKSRGAFDNGQ